MATTTIDCATLGQDELKYLLSLSQDDQIKALQIGIMALSHAGVRPKVQTSSRIGAAGEDAIKDILCEYFKVINVSKIAQSCDLLIQNKGKRILVEVKNYTTVIGQPQIDKFIRDVSVNSACGGIFISMNTPIRGISSKFYICNELIDGRLIPTAYIQGTDTDTILCAVSVIGDMATVNAERKDASSDVIKRDLECAVESLERISHNRNNITSYMSEIVSGYHKHIANMIIAESDMRDKLSTLRDNLYQYDTCQLECPVDSIGIKSDTYKLICLVTDKMSGEWTRTKNKYINSNGMGFVVEKDCVYFYVNRSRLSHEKIIDIVSMSDIIINKSTVSILINADTVDCIIGVVSIV